MLRIFPPAEASRLATEECSVVTKRQTTEERRVIFRKPEKRPYGARLAFQILHKGFLGDMEQVTVLLDSGAVASLMPAHQSSWEGGRRFEFALEGFPTAAVAELQGRQLSQAILWMAISLNYGLRLTYHTQEPSTVFERKRSSGGSFGLEGASRLNPQNVLRELLSGFSAQIPDAQTLLSMEIFASSSLEASDRACFLTAVSALEPLGKEQSLGQPVDTFVNECVTSLHAATSIDSKYRASLEGRLNQLRQESIRQALRRLISDNLSDYPEAPAVVDRAYGLRSELIHNGRLADYDVDLAAETQKVSNVLRLIYSRRLGLPLYVPAA